MPGMTTVILRGPLKPSTLVSCQIVSRGRPCYACTDPVSVRVFSAHIANGSQFLPLVALLQQGSGVLAWIVAVVEDGEFGAHEVGPGRRRRRPGDYDALPDGVAAQTNTVCHPPDRAVPQFTDEALALSGQVGGVH